jgi:hypothetical protein
MRPLCTLSNVFGREMCKDLNDDTVIFADHPQAAWISKSVLYPASQNSWEGRTS